MITPGGNRKHLEKSTWNASCLEGNSIIASKPPQDSSSNSDDTDSKALHSSGADTNKYAIPLSPLKPTFSIPLFSLHCREDKPASPPDSGMDGEAEIKGNVYLFLY